MDEPSTTPAAAGSPPPSAVLDQLVELSRVMVAIAYRSVQGVEAELDLLAFRALAFVDANAGCAMGALSSGIDVPASSTTRLCDRLVAAGWLLREPDQNNRRQMTLELTRDGRALVRKVLRARRREMAGLTAQLTPEQHAALTSLLATILSGTVATSPAGSSVWSL